MKLGSACCAFHSLEGVGITLQGNPFPLDCAARYGLSPVPEPATWALWSLGLAVWDAQGLRARRQALARSTGSV